MANQAPAKFGADYYARQYRARRWRERGDKPIVYGTLIRKLSKMAPCRLLDVGCGEGHFLKRASRRFECSGIEISEAAVARARVNSGLSTIRQGSAVDLDFEANSFDVVCSFDVIEHLPQPEGFFAEAARVLRPGGILVISTPNPGSFGHARKGHDSFIYADATHVSVQPVEFWRDCLTTHGFEIVRDGTDTLWDTPYFRRVPRRLQWALFTAAAQMLWRVDVVFPWSRGENYVCFARAATGLASRSSQGVA